MGRELFFWEGQDCLLFLCLSEKGKKDRQGVEKVNTLSPKAQFMQAFCE